MTTKKPDELKVNPEFESYLPPLDKDTDELLRASIKEQGIRDPIIVWKEKSVVVDGHNRLRVAKELGLKTVPVTEQDFKDADDVRMFMLRAQLARRNLSKEAASEARGRLVALMKSPAMRRKTGLSETAARKAVAKQQGVSEATARRDAAFAAGLEKLRKTMPDEAKALVKGASKVNKATVEELGKASSKADETKAMTKVKDEVKRAHKKDTTSTKPKATVPPSGPKPEPAKAAPPEPAEEEKPITDKKPAVEPKDVVFGAMKMFFTASTKSGRVSALRAVMRAYNNPDYTMPPEYTEEKPVEEISPTTPGNADLRGAPDFDFSD